MVTELVYVLTVDMNLYICLNSQNYTPQKSQFTPQKDNFKNKIKVAKKLSKV